MGASIRIQSAGDLQALRARLLVAREHARAAVRKALDAPNFMSLLKFERLGCDPVDVSDPQNIAEQIDQQATYEAGVLALELLMVRHPGLTWDFAPGAHGAGHDILSTDGQVVAEVFAAVDPKNNGKLNKDIQKVRASASPLRYVLFRSPSTPPSERRVEGVVVLALPSDDQPS